MYYRVMSSALMGIEGYIVNVEVDIAAGFPRFDVVGLPDSSVREATDRVRTSLRNSGFGLPIERITVNLAPAHMRKEGVGFDLAIAIGILACKEKLPRKSCEGVLFLGELSLSGEVRPIKGMLPMIHSASKVGVTKCLVPYDNANEAGVVPGVEVIGVHDLVEAVGYLKGVIDIKARKVDVKKLFTSEDMIHPYDFSDVKGQEHVKRALEIAAAGMHNVMMIGPPGSGKTMMAKRIPSILPKINYNESIDITKIFSVSGKLASGSALVTSRPFRSPHHTISNASLVGGGSIPKPGEISLAHHGVLFLDELPEFQKNVIEVLRQPMEDGLVTISRVNATLVYPAKFMLVCSMNPCPCGYYPDVEKCHCTPWQIKRYLSKVSGPLLDRIDLHIEAGKIDFDDLCYKDHSESSVDIAGRVIKSIAVQKERHKDLPIVYNAHLRPKDIDRICALDSASKKMLKLAFEKMGLSARAYHRILKVARTIADLEGSRDIKEPHIAEAIQYRTLDRKYWNR